MKIIHCCLSCFYIDGYNYQENMLVREHVQAGHEVLVLASTETYDAQGNLTYCPPGLYLGSDGARVVRLPYMALLPHNVMRKLRAYPEISRHLTEFEPSVILFHGACAWALKTVVRYKKNNPSVRLYLDSHEDFNNSARGFLSKNILHRLFYKPIFRASLPFVEKVLCISTETLEFIRGFYGCPEDKLEYFPLGGAILPDSAYEAKRASARQAHGIASDELLFFQSGKFDRKKKLRESLTAFQKLPSTAPVKYLIAGVLQEDVRPEVEDLLQHDERVTFLGWKNAEELTELLCAADVYVQPGSQSATLQNSICCRCAVIADDVTSHYPFVKDNGWLVSGEEALAGAFESAVAVYEDGGLELTQAASLRIARELLDYENLARRLTS